MSDSLEKVVAALAQWKAAEAQLKGAQEVLNVALSTSMESAAISGLRLKVEGMRETTDRFYRESLSAMQAHHEQRIRKGVSGS